MEDAAQEQQKFDPVTALDRRTGPRDRRTSDRGGDASDRRQYKGLFGSLRIRESDSSEHGSKNRMRSGGILSSTRAKVICIIIIALICSLGAASLINTWFEGELARYKSSMEKPVKVAAAPTVKVVVAKTRLNHGDELTSSNIKIINWQADAVPKGFFSSQKILLNKHGKRMALLTIQPNEPIMATKITGPGIKASLSSMLSEGKKAVTIRVNDVFGVAGLIHPNDRVDVLWTMTRPEGKLEQEPFTELLLKEVRVLAIDQRISDDTKKANVAKAVTIEVDLEQAQKVVLGSKTGSLHLALRGTKSAIEEKIDRVRLSKLGYSASKTSKKSPGSKSTVVITRGVVRQNYQVNKGIAQ